MSLCETCQYNPWESSNPITEEDYLEKLRSVGVTPCDEGPKRVSVGSPFRVPLPLTIKLCCLDEQICVNQGVEFSKLSNKNEVNVEINSAKAAVYQEAGLPTISGS